MRRLSQKGKINKRERERTHRLRHQCDDWGSGGEWEKVKEGIKGINGDEKNKIILKVLSTKWNAGHVYLSNYISRICVPKTAMKTILSSIFLLSNIYVTF